MSIPQSDELTLVRGDDKTYVVVVKDSLGAVVVDFSETDPGSLALPMYFFHAAFSGSPSSLAGQPASLLYLS